MTTLNRWITRCATVTGAFLVACSSNEHVPPVTVSPGDGNYEAHAFVVAAHMGELEESRLALTTLSAPAVRTFAQQMVRDHSIALQKAQTLGKELGIEWPAPVSGNAAPGGFPAADISAASVTNWTFAATPMGKNEAVLARSTWAKELMENHRQAVPVLISWMPLSGSQFDREFMNRQVTLHRFVLASIDRILPSVGQSALRTAIAGERTAIAGHLRMAEQIHQSAQ